MATLYIRKRGMGAAFAKRGFVVGMSIGAEELDYPGMSKSFIYSGVFNISMNLNENADEIAALAMVFAGILVMIMSVSATLFFGATSDMGDAFKVVEGVMFLAAGYLFRGHVAGKK